MLRAAAKRLRLGIPGPLNADALEALALAMEQPHAYALRIGGHLSHDYFLPTADGINRAARDAGFAPDEFGVVPMISLDVMPGSVNT